MAVKTSTAEALRSAMRRLVNGAAIHTGGELTWENVWREAGVPRATANRATDVKAEWKELLEVRADDPNAVKTVGEKVRELQQKLDEKDRESAETNKGLRNTINIMANHIQALTLALRKAEEDAKGIRTEMARLQAELAQGVSNVTSLPSRRP